MASNDDFSARLYAARDVTALRELLREVNERAQMDAHFRPRRIRTAILRTLRDVVEDADTAREILLEELWPRCVQGFEDDGQPSSSVEMDEAGTRVLAPSRPQEATWEAHEARELLASWLAAWLEVGNSELRVETCERSCDAALRVGAGVAEVQAACWTLHEIGWRSERVENTLWRLASRNDIAGDVAGGVLASLGLDPSRRDEFIAQWRKRARLRPIRYNSHAAITLASPELVEDAIAMFHATSSLRWFDGSERPTAKQIERHAGAQDEASQNEDADDGVKMEMDMKLTFLSHLADALCDHAPSQDILWKTIFRRAIRLRQAASI